MPPSIKSPLDGVRPNQTSLTQILYTLIIWLKWGIYRNFLVKDYYV
jgi:hypothetical protein